MSIEVLTEDDLLIEDRVIPIVTGDTGGEADLEAILAPASLFSEGDAAEIDEVSAEARRVALRCNLEALLFVASEPITLARLAVLTNSPQEDIAEALAELEAEYANRGITIRIVAGGYRFATSPQCRPVVEAHLMPPKTSLSNAALETLAVVAYSGPVTKAEIEAVRGVNVDGVVSNLVERGLLCEAGRKETVGKPMLFTITGEFLQAFGLGSLAELPPLPSEQLELLTKEAAGEVAILEGTAESIERVEETVAETVAELDEAVQTAEPSLAQGENEFQE